jgi:hypothetical protein
MSEVLTTEARTASVSYDLLNGTSQGFQDVVMRIAAWARAQPFEPLNLSTGVHTITPEAAERLLNRNGQNRPVSFSTVLNYAMQMRNNQWAVTGQPIIINKNGMMEDGQHRALAAYLGKQTFATFVVTGVEPGLFAFLDNSRPRTGGDTLRTAGVNGLSTHIAAVVKGLAGPWDAGALRIRGRASPITMSNREVLAYAQANPSLIEAAKVVQGTYKYNARRFTNAAVATFFGWKVIQEFGEDALDQFMTALNDQGLPEGNPVLAFKRKLEANKIVNKRTRTTPPPLSMAEMLAYAIKAFNAMHAGQALTEKKLKLSIDEEFPQFQVDSEPEAEAA